MTAVLAVNFGPVQDFIASARRTRDLWAGSRLLSEASRAAALALREQGATLIFPTAEALDDGGANVANQLLVITPPDVDPAVLARQCVKAARTRLNELRNEIKGELLNVTSADIMNAVMGPSADQQLDDLLEAYWAWAPSAGGATGYQQARQEAMKLLAARKATRNFAPVTWGSSGPKSTLDGQREAVTVPLRGRNAGKRLGLQSGELLCAPGLVKRVARFGQGSRVRFLSTSHVAAAPYIDRLKRGDTANLQDAYRRLFDRLNDLNLPIDDFDPDDLDPRMLYPSRILEDVPDSLVTPAIHEAVLDASRRFYRELGRAHDRPSPYYALLLGDGDGMGKVIGTLTDPTDHQRLSNALHAFSRECAEVVQRHRGVLIYAGGDDVMALLPTPDAVPCALELSEVFRRHLSPFQYEVDTGRFAGQVRSPTLTSGLVIAHMLDPLRDVLSAVRAAEKAGKTTGRITSGDRLHIELLKRSGAPTAVNLPNTELQPRLLDLVTAFNERALPTKLGYELRSLGDELGRVGNVGLERAEIKRVLGRKRVADDTLTAGELRPTMSTEVQSRLLALFDQFAAEQEGSAGTSPLRRIGDLLILAVVLAGQHQERTE